MILWAQKFISFDDGHFRGHLNLCFLNKHTTIKLNQHFIGIFLWIVLNTKYTKLNVQRIKNYFTVIYSFHQSCCYPDEAERFITFIGKIIIFTFLIYAGAYWEKPGLNCALNISFIMTCH